MPEKEAGMSSTSAPLTTVTLEDGTFAVVKPDPHKPGLLEMIAIFFDAAPKITPTEKTAALRSPRPNRQGPRHNGVLSRLHQVRI
jgi:hypothetical protein